MGVCIAIAGQKGGVGKSSLACNLSSYFSTKIGAKTCLVDADTQKTSKNWAKRRDANKGDNNTIKCLSLVGDLYEPLKDLSKNYDVVIVDNAGYINESLETSLLAADLVITPYGYDSFDLETAPKMFNVIKNAKRFNKPLESYALISKVQNHSARAMRDRVKNASDLFDDNNINRFKTVLHSRVAVAKANDLGLGVVELEKGYGTKAKDELNDLCEELLEWIKQRQQAH